MRDVAALADLLRRNGVRRVAFFTAGDIAGGDISELELVDGFDPDGDGGTTLVEVPKQPGLCIEIDCQEMGGWTFDKRYCPVHGRMAAGVKR